MFFFFWKINKNVLFPSKNVINGIVKKIPRYSRAVGFFCNDMSFYHTNILGCSSNIPGDVFCITISIETLTDRLYIFPGWNNWGTTLPPKHFAYQGLDAQQMLWACGCPMYSLCIHGWWLETFTKLPFGLVQMANS